MSDNTAAAREPSMEDILASIRRIIDEEDTRDARPSSDLAVDPAESGDAAEVGTPPVMAAASVDRDDASQERDAVNDDEDGDSIFPERESLFWSRATGRGDAAEGDAPEDALQEAQEAGTTGDARTDIFRRAQSKLGSIARPGGARERIQSLAARAEERAETKAEDRESLADFTDLPDQEDADGIQDDTARAVAALADADEADDRDATGFATLDDSDILDLTDPLDPVEAVDDTVSTRFDNPSDEEDRMDDASDADSHADERPVQHDPESFRSMAGDMAHERAIDADDVLDLTMPLGEEAPAVEEGSVESGASFHVSGVDRDGGGHDSDEADSEGHDIEEAISLNLGTEDDAPASEATYHDAEPEGDDRRDGESRGEEDAPDLHDSAVNTYSRFDAASPPLASSLADFAPEEPEEEEEAREDEAETGYAATDEADRDAVVTVDDIGEEEASEGDSPEGESFGAALAATGDSGADEETFHGPATDTAQEPEEDERIETVEAADEEAPRETAFADTDALSDTPDSYAAAFTMLGDNPPAESATDSRAGDDDDDLDHLDMGDELGFSDTFSASDVYHDDPPALDEDYSRSLDVEDEPVGTQGAEREDDPQDDDGMEKVGGLVRDAMERDPVDYADPSALVSMTSEEISARALASLADVEGEASRRMFGSLRISDDDGSESLEGMVRGMLRPLLREWLDDNLPNMVETAVRGEVERISAKSRKYSRAADKD